MQHLNTWLSDCNSWLRLFLQYSFDNKTDNFDDLPARFGYRLPSEGLKVSKLYDIDERHSILKNKIIYIYIYIYVQTRGRPIWVFLLPMPIFRNQGQYMMPIFFLFFPSSHKNLIKKVK